MKIETFADTYLEAAHIGPFADEAHGHTWLIRVWFRTALRAPTNLADRLAVVRRALAPLDHKTIDDVLGRENATCEGLASYLLTWLEENGATRVQVWRPHGALPGGAEASV